MNNLMCSTPMLEATTSILLRMQYSQVLFRIIKNTLRDISAFELDRIYTYCCTNDLRKGFHEVGVYPCLSHHFFLSDKRIFNPS